MRTRFLSAGHLMTVISQSYYMHMYISQLICPVSLLNPVLSPSLSLYSSSCTCSIVTVTAIAVTSLIHYLKTSKAHAIAQFKSQIKVLLYSYTFCIPMFFFPPYMYVLLLHVNDQRSQHAIRIRIPYPHFSYPHIPLTQYRCVLLAMGHRDNSELQQQLL